MRFEERAMRRTILERRVHVVTIIALVCAFAFGTSPFLATTNALALEDAGEATVVLTTAESDDSVLPQAFQGYLHDPMTNPKAAADILEDPNAVYGYVPNPASARLGPYADFDFTDPTAVASARQDREEYHESVHELYVMIEDMKDAGYTIEQIARAVSGRRNQIRLEYYRDDPEGLAMVKESNLAKYGNEMGGTPEFFYEKYGSWEAIIEGSLSTNAGMDAILGLYDKYYDTYIIGSGSCGTDGDEDSVTWTVNADVLYIDGSGAMADYARTKDTPWYPYAADFSRVLVDKGVTHVAEHAFDGFRNRPTEIGGHRWERLVEKVTMNADGLVSRHCNVCGADQTLELLPRIASVRLEKESFAYTGKAIRPTVVVSNEAGIRLSGIYTVSFANNVEVGTATATVRFEGGYYEGSKTLSFRITKATNPLDATGRTVCLKAWKLRNGSQAITRTKALKISKAQGGLSYQKVSVSKPKYKKKFSVNAKTAGQYPSKGAFQKAPTRSR